MEVDGALFRATFYITLPTIPTLLYRLAMPFEHLFFFVLLLQHVHNCLLKQPSSGKKALPLPASPRGSLGQEPAGSRARAGGAKELQDPVDSPRSTRVSLQGVFSPKVGVHS